MTDITVFTQALQAENLEWDLSNPGVPFAEGGTLEPALFNSTQHYPNGYIPSGTVLGRVTATGRLGPYLNAAADGRETAVGILKASVQVVQPNGALRGYIGVAFYSAFAVVSAAKLPLTVGGAALGGYLDAPARTDLPRIHFAA